MDLFPDGAHVRLGRRSPAMYFHAGEDGVAVDLRPLHPSLNLVWSVHRVVRDGDTYVLLHGAAYGRYLALRELAEQPDNLADGLTYHFVQALYDAPEQDEVLWQFHMAADGNDDDVVMSNLRYGGWGDDEEPDGMMRLMVQAVPPRLQPPALPDAIPPMVASSGGPILGHRRVALPVPQRRMIRYTQEDDPLRAGDLWFDGRSVSHLRRDLAGALGVEDELNITLCVRAGHHGRLTPLVVDLPSNNHAMEIVVLATGSPAADALVYPDVDAPAP